jgi:hypothetical protein
MFESRARPLGTGLIRLAAVVSAKSGDALGRNRDRQTAARQRGDTDAYRNLFAELVPRPQ